MPVLIPDKVSYGTKNTTREKDIWIIIIKKNHFKEENGTKCCSPNNIGLKYIKKKKNKISFARASKTIKYSGLSLTE